MRNFSITLKEFSYCLLLLLVLILHYLIVPLALVIVDHGNQGQTCHQQTQPNHRRSQKTQQFPSVLDIDPDVLLGLFRQINFEFLQITEVILFLLVFGNADEQFFAFLNFVHYSLVLARLILVENHYLGRLKIVRQIVPLEFLLEKQKLLLFVFQSHEGPVPIF